MNRTSRGGIALATLVVGLLGADLCHAQPSTLYSYDTGNHLIQGTATTGSAVQYQYDAAGNVVGVTSVSPTVLTVGVQQGVTIGTLGQAALLTFNASAGESVTLNLGSISTTPVSTPLTVGVYDSTGTLIGSVNSGTSTTLTLSNLSGGAYTLSVAPQSPATANLLLASTG